MLRLIGEDLDSPDVFTDTDEGMAPIRDSINDAIEELCMTTGHYRRRYFLACQEERAIYRLAPENDYLGWVIRVWDNKNKRSLDQTSITALSNYDPRFLKQNGVPTHWYQMGWEHIGVYYRPSEQGMVLELDCLMVPKPYTYDTQPIQLRTHWQRAAVYRALSDYHAIRGDAARGQEYFIKYLETAGLMGLNPLGPERIWRMGGPTSDLG